ncbi:MAG: response regulator [Acidobacteria bacterium]|nr:response regulator [Acidobacteriota bacterium]
MHSLLLRQLRRHFGSADAIPDGWKLFVESVDSAYRQSDADRRMLERSLELSSQELLQANSEMRAVFQAFPDLFFRLDREGRIVDYKGSGKDLCVASEEIIGKRIQDVPVTGVGAAFRDALQQVRDTSSIVTIEYSMPIQGSERYFEARLLPMMHDQIIAIVRNITERRHLEEQLIQSQKMEAIGQLAGGVAHDFNNILTAILGYADLMLADLPAGSHLEAYGSEVKVAAERGAALTRQLLAFSRRQLLQVAILDLNEVVGEVEQMLRRLIGENIVLVTNLEPELTRVKADPTQVQQVILNLALNARDAMPGGGALSIRTSNLALVSPTTLEGADLAAGLYAVLEISDTGAGMEPEILPRIFEPFFTTKEKGKGTGLGLATVYGIVRQSGGMITVESVPRRGSTFRIFLPGATQTAEPRSSDPPARVGPRGYETILLAEDEENVRTLVRTVLESIGYTVLDASGGDHALEMADRHPGPIHLLVTDIVMPQMSGSELAKRLVDRFPAMKVLFMSGYAEKYPRGFMATGGSAFLQKPFTAAALAQQIRILLGTDRAP